MAKFGSQDVQVGDCTFCRWLNEVFEAEVFSFSEWANILQVQEMVMITWIMGRKLPSPEQLRSILRLLGHNTGTPVGVLPSFKKLAKEPLKDVVLAQTNVLHETLGHYLAAPTRSMFLQHLDTLDPRTQEKVLLQAIELVRQQWREQRELEKH